LTTTVKRVPPREKPTTKGQKPLLSKTGKVISKAMAEIRVPLPKAITAAVKARPGCQPMPRTAPTSRLEAASNP
jgi:hypothetical protein